MLLSMLVNQTVFVGETPRGVCKGVGVSPKNGAIKYLLCASAPHLSSPDFAVNVSAVERFEPLTLFALRTTVPKRCAKLFLSTPVYSSEGKYLGNLKDAEFENGQTLRLCTSKNLVFSFLSLAAVSDAVILKKEQPYPIGQRIPAPIESNLLVTKSVLKNAVEKGELIKLTLSLAPFSLSL